MTVHAYSDNPHYYAALITYRGAYANLSLHSNPLLSPSSGEHSILPIALISAILITVISSCPLELEYVWINLIPLNSTGREYRLQELD